LAGYLLPPDFAGQGADAMRKQFRLAVFLATAFAAGCAGDGSLAGADYSAPGACGALARQRLNEARMIDLAAGYEKAIFDNTYRDCLARQANEPLPRR
jgi:hypothetical protein